VVIAGDHSCTNTSNPSVLTRGTVGAQTPPAKGLAAKALGQDLAGAGQPGGREYLSNSGLQLDLDKAAST